MLNLDENNLQNHEFTIDENKLNNILDTAIANDSSLIVGKLPIKTPIYSTSFSANSTSSDQNKTSVLALTVRPTKESFLKGVRMSIKVAVSTFFIQLARIFI